MYRAVSIAAFPLAAVAALPLLMAATGLTPDVLLDNLEYVLVGVTGAIFANATGAGGGVVFIPLFSQLGFTDAQSVATSFGIQCFGMTTGAIAWTAYFLAGRRSAPDSWAGFLPAIAITTPASLAGLWFVQYVGLAPPVGTVTVFAVFSLLLGAAILSLRGDRTSGVRSGLDSRDIVTLVAVAAFGGIVTAWLSVGVGEFVGFYLILRRYDVTQSIAVAVVLSALTVWGAAPHELVSGANAVWEVVLTAGPGALIGALIARWLAVYLGGIRLKRFFGIWLVLIGVSELLSHL